ncbi:MULTISPECIES: hypothetical protein [unclassified Moorena]|uniref:hypothetical protein n=1 Tax=unclassified Moorena TaxID=2683338 RepID=UPI0013BCC021|nr:MULTISPECIES: hypothetical protein [unclassified Moorena]NEO23363.1 hypothetical protein [Moorena sp. SIO4A5]NEQ61008.1 hypothetical protein [Moorena sp. SIO4A1]NEQ85623.1 hypothetical protein [Moorena sp. SIO2I5]
MAPFEAASLLGATRGELNSPRVAPQEFVPDRIENRCMRCTPDSKPFKLAPRVLPKRAIGVNHVYYIPK